MQLLKISTKICISIILISSILLCSKTSDAGCLWINKSRGLAGYELTSLTVDRENSDTIYIGSKGFLFKTSDGGENWKNIFKVPGTNKTVNFIAIHPQNTKIIYIAAESGLFKSVDGGMNWQSMSLGREADNVLTLLIDSENTDTLFAATGKDIFITKDAGRNWTRSSQGLSGRNLRSMAQNYIDREILFAAAGNSLFKSVNGSRNWTKIFSTDSITEEEIFENEYNTEAELSISSGWVSVDPFDPEIIYLSAKRGVFKSDDSGDSWTRLPRTGLAGSHIKNLAFPSYNRGFIFAATEDGIFRFSEEENMWREFYSGLTSKEAVFIALNERQDALWMITKNNIFKSKGHIYEIKEIPPADKADVVLESFSHEPNFREIQEAAIKYAEVHPEKITKWRWAAKQKALLPRLTFGIDQSKDDYYYGGVQVGDDEDTGWDITCTWDLGELIWNNDQTLIDVRSKLMVQLRDDILDEVTRLYFERRRLQVEFIQDPPKDINRFIEKKLRLEELTADIDAMTGGYLSREIERRKDRV